MLAIKMTLTAYEMWKLLLESNAILQEPVQILAGEVLLQPTVYDLLQS